MKYYPSEHYGKEKPLQRWSISTQIHAHSNCRNSLRVVCIKLLFFFFSKRLKYQLMLFRCKYEGIISQYVMHFPWLSEFLIILSLLFQHIKTTIKLHGWSSVKYWNCVRRIARFLKDLGQLWSNNNAAFRNDEVIKYIIK